MMGIKSNFNFKNIPRDLNSGVNSFLRKYPKLSVLCVGLAVHVLTRRSPTNTRYYPVNQPQVPVPPERGRLVQQIFIGSFRFQNLSDNTNAQQTQLIRTTVAQFFGEYRNIGNLSHLLVQENTLLPTIPLIGLTDTAFSDLFSAGQNNQEYVLEVLEHAKLFLEKAIYPLLIKDNLDPHDKPALTQIMQMIHNQPEEADLLQYYTELSAQTDEILQNMINPPENSHNGLSDLDESYNRLRNTVLLLKPILVKVLKNVFSSFLDGSLDINNYLRFTIGQMPTNFAEEESPMNAGDYALNTMVNRVLCAYIKCLEHPNHLIVRDWRLINSQELTYILQPVDRFRNYSILQLHRYPNHLLGLGFAALNRINDAGMGPIGPAILPTSDWNLNQGMNRVIAIIVNNASETLGSVGSEGTRPLTPRPIRQRRVQTFILQDERPNTRFSILTACAQRVSRITLAALNNRYLMIGLSSLIT